MLGCFRSTFLGPSEPRKMNETIDIDGKWVIDQSKLLDVSIVNYLNHTINHDIFYIQIYMLQFSNTLCVQLPILSRTL